MSVTNGQLANAATFNGAFVSKTADSTVSAIITQDKESVLKEIATPVTPASGYGKIYFKSDGKLYQLNDAGVETQVGSGGGGGGGGVNFISNGDAEGAVTTGWTQYAESDAVTFQDTGDTVTLNSHGLANGNEVSFTSITSTTGISINTRYFVISATTNTFQVASSFGGSALPLTTNGSGTMVRFYPKAGSGGSPNVTITTTNTTPLVGSYSFLFAKDAANRQGQGWAFDFTIDLAYRAKVLEINFDYLVNTGTFSAGGTGTNSDVTVWIYDVTNATLIQPSNVKLFSNNASISDKFSATFQTASNSSSYRLIFHVQSVSASAYTLEIDSVSVSPAQYSFGTPVTDWQSFTPTGSWTTNTTYTGQWRRVGDSIDIRGRISLSGAPNAVTLTVNIPFGLAIDTNKIASDAQRTLGLWSGTDTGVQSYTGVIRYASTNSVGLDCQNGSLTTYVIPALVNATVPFTWGNTDLAHFSFSVPIVGWSSSVQTSDSADTRVVAARYINNQASTTSTTTPFNFTDRVFDTHGAVTTGSGWRFTAPVAGIYRVSAITGATTQAGCDLYKNGVVYARLFSVNSIYQLNGSALVDMVAGDYIDLRSSSSVTANTGTTFHINIERLSGPSAIAASETVACRYVNTAGTSITGTQAQIPFVTKSYDTHNAFSGTVFTVPISGKYLITAKIGIVLTSGDALSLGIRKNGSQISFMRSRGNVSDTMVNISDQHDLVAGDTIDFTANSANNSTLITTVGYNHITIVRVGN